MFRDVLYVRINLLLQRYIVVLIIFDNRIACAIIIVIVFLTELEVQ